MVACFVILSIQTGVYKSYDASCTSASQARKEKRVLYFCDNRVLRARDARGERGVPVSARESR